MELTLHNDPHTGNNIVRSVAGHPVDCVPDEEGRPRHLAMLTAPPPDRRHREHTRHNSQLLEHMQAHPLLNSAALLAAAANLRAVTGIEPQTLEAMHRHQVQFENDRIWTAEPALQTIMEWSDLRLGKDLFIKGLGGFDIMAAVEKQSTHIEPDEVDHDGGEFGDGSGHRGWLGFTAELMQARGYFPDQYPRVGHAYLVRV